jgi:diketogulonate reductase-like aldo/keto reductase
MNIPRKELDSGFSLPELSMGTWMIGGAETRDSNCNEESAVRSIRRGIEAGFSCIDTAEMYAGGFTEELIGRAVQANSRDQLQVMSKVSPQNLRYDDVLRSAEASLKRLKLDYLDVYLIHKPNPTIPLRETMKAMRALREEGLIREVGASNFSVTSLRKAQESLGAPVVLNQVHYNLIYREPEISDLLGYCQDNDVFLMAWRPLEKGAILENCPSVLDEVCTKYDRSPAQVAINWLVSQDKVVTLSTMRSERHLRDNLGAVGWYLQSEDIEKLREQFPNQKKVSNREPLI